MLNPDTGASKHMPLNASATAKKPVNRIVVDRPPIHNIVRMKMKATANSASTAAPVP